VLHQVGITVGISVPERLITKQRKDVSKKNCCEEPKCDTEMRWVYRRYISPDRSLVRFDAKGNVQRTQKETRA
jgi:hypothetical protein